jgi:hypothetical protein
MSVRLVGGKGPFEGPISILKLGTVPTMVCFACFCCHLMAFNMQTFHYLCLYPSILQMTFASFKYITTHFLGLVQARQ